MKPNPTAARGVAVKGCGGVAAGTGVVVRAVLMWRRRWRTLGTSGGGHHRAQQCVSARAPGDSGPALGNHI